MTAEWLARAHDREVVGLILTLVAVCTLGKRALLLFPHSTQVYLNGYLAIDSERFVEC